MFKFEPKILLSYMTLTVTNYASAVEAYGCISYIAEPGKGIPECDGLILVGGVDVHPKYYGEDMNGTGNVDDVRDTFEMELIDKYAKAGKPILGICRGVQLMNIYFGGTLHQDLAFVGNCHRNDKPEGALHNVKAAEGSILSEMYGGEFSVNSFHHQAVKDVAPGFFASAFCSDTGIVEAIQHESKPMMGVQWHPERMCLSHRRADTANGIDIFGWFAKKCRG